MWLSELLLVGLLVSFADSYDRRVNYWDAFASGKLLERLNALTDVDQSKVDKLPGIMQVTATTTTRAQAKADDYLDVDVDADAVNEEVDSQSAETSHEGYSGEDYERNYEHFVKEYFDRDAAGANIDDVRELQEETQAVEPTNIKDHRCRRVKRKDGKLCEVCIQLKNNEVSETCSYSHENQPEQYAYGSDTQYKRYRTDPQKKKDYQKLKPDAPSSLCLRHQQENRVCYECKDSKDQKIERCYDVQARKSNNKTKKKRASSSKRKPRSQSEKELSIYKRTNSYSYIPL
ncbi:LOW QUALITY PROTEIN: uncharacterized protein LOC110191986 [Drosophila serrata]|uniref:LOW QUALITY PROTEIN: uncharacterized protein LOC110191986 n=1 Tax=Drosophila serrata TaxID=7274 RepID=UPI000A1D34CD|nr:LOW QUALITY PROTEIN: uncharacterized protein LOC110191986 [Drosophila serrata]